jgi:hypothetical protein
MPKQTVPDIDFRKFVIAEFPDLFAKDTIFINKDYQRGDIWNPMQKIELIRSIVNRYSIGVLVLFINDKDQYEILDGQQRILTIRQYLEGELDLSNTDITAYADLTLQEKTLLDAYCVFYLKLKSHDPDSKEEDIVQTFLRLQEGTPLNKAEKINAHRGQFKDAFREIREQHPLFGLLGGDKRFRLRQLAAELLTLELEGDFKNRIFPDLSLTRLIATVEKYAKGISKSKRRFFKGNLDYLHNSLNILLTAFKPADLISFYLLVSYLRRHKAGNENLVNELAEFCRQFLENLSRFSMYDSKPPRGMTRHQFDIYLKYKLAAKRMTLSESIKERFEIILAEFSRIKPYIEKDEKRLHDIEQKRTLYFRQKGLCAECGKAMHFKQSSGHHVVAHSAGGRTADLDNCVLVHEKCHRRLEKQIEKKKT